MAVVRELVTRLGFEVDKKGINEFNQSIIGFKTGVALAATGLVGVASQAINFFSDFSKTLNSSKDLADSTGTTLSNLLSMGKAASQFRISSAEFLSIYSSFNGIVQQAKAGSGELFNIAKQTGIEFRKNNGDIEETEIIFQRILVYLGNIEDDQERIRISNKFFTSEFGARFANLAKEFDKFNEAREKFSQTSKEIENSVEASKNFEVSLIRLSESWKSFVEVLLVNVVPALTFILDLLTSIVDISSKIITPAFKGTLNAIQTIGEGLTKDIFDDSTFEDLQRLERFNNLGTAQNEINQTNSFNFNVPEGTSEEQAKFLRNSVLEAVNVAMEESFMQILNNNPVVA